MLLKTIAISPNPDLLKALNTNKKQAITVQSLGISIT
jgi:hypothetical protein